MHTHRTTPGGRRRLAVLAAAWTALALAAPLAAADRDPRKRPKLIDRLLASDEFATHWARYWRDVMAARLTDFRGRLLARSFEQWMAEQLKKDRRWDQVVRDLLTAEGEARFDDA